MSTVAPHGPSSAPTTSYYPLESPFSFNFGGDEYGLNPASVSPDMTRYLKSPTPSAQCDGEGQEGSHQPQHTPPSHLQSPSSYDMANLSLHSPTGPASQPHSQPIPIQNSSHHHVSPESHGHGNSLGSSSSLPHRNGYHQLYHPYARPSDQSNYLFRSPPGSSHSANSGPLSSALVSPMTDLAEMSPLPITYYGHTQYIASALTGHAGMSPTMDQQPRAMGMGLGMSMDDGNGTVDGLGLVGTGGMHFAPYPGDMGLGLGQIPQYPPGNAGNGVSGRGKGKGRGGRGGGAGTGVVRGARRKISVEGSVVTVKVKKEAGGMEGDDEEEDEDAEGESVPGDSNSGTHKSHLEKRRRLILKRHFAALANVLEPITGGSGKGSTKVNTLERATIKIQALTSAVNSISQQNQELCDALMEERHAHAETLKLNSELSRALAAIRTGGSSPLT